MTKVRKKIGTIPINDIEQQVQQSTSAAITQMQQDVSDFIDEETAQYPEIGGTFKYIADQEGRIEISTDAKGKILSYRDANGKIHEEAGIETSNLILTDDGAKNLKSQLDEAPSKKNWYLPKFGKVNIKSETFYLTAYPGWSTKDDVVCIQMYDDTDANATQRVILSYYYIKSTLTPLSGGDYDKTSVDGNSVRLDLFAGKEVGQTFGTGTDSKIYFTDEVTKVNNIYYATSSLVNGEVVPESIVVTESSTKTYYVKKVKQVDGVWYLNSTLEDGSGAQQQVNYKNETVNGKPMISVSPVTDVPPYKAWCVNKKPEHYCVADIDFGTFYNKKNVPISIKYQGSGSTAFRKRGFRLTFYKKSDYNKKDKVKIGEMVRLSGYNMKSFAVDNTLIGDPICSNLMIESWEINGNKCYPWANNSVPYCGATGMIKSFPIETWFGEEFFGLQFFGLKKDEKNYMLDGDDDASGIFVSGGGIEHDAWSNGDHTRWEDEMMDEMSQETADALDEMHKYIKGFIEGTIEIDGQQVEFTSDMLEEHIDIASWIDYFIAIQIFLLADNVHHNMILYSGKDKKKFYAFVYDLDTATRIHNYKFSLDDYIATLPSGYDMSFWDKFYETYKDSIINRYFELRKSVFSIKNIRSIYLTYVMGIPNEVKNMEQIKWGSNTSNFENYITYLTKRLEYLDNNYFNL